MEVGVDLFPEVLSHQFNADAFSMYTKEKQTLRIKTTYAGEKYFLHKICSLSISPDICYSYYKRKSKLFFKMNFSRYLFGKFQGSQGFLNTNNRFHVIPGFPGFEGLLEALRY